ncbi:exodeoxyribonuclease VII large subunit [soil metagenome]
MEPQPDRPVLKPSQLNALARELLEGQFGQVWLQGEISNFSRPASGHMYFTLKDDRAQVRCALFRMQAARLRFLPRDGMQVLGRGRLTVYEARGEYQLVLDHMEEAGEGALRQAFEELKRRLADEGLFDASRKRKLPRFVRRLGVITSPRGAAVRDVLSVLARRFPMLEVDVLPAAVQGQGAAAELRATLQRAGASGRYDVLLLTRGGGSLEDLWSFNDEALARAIAASPIPVVSAVGHEIDFSLADFAADLRAPTPSAAAELLVPDAVALSAQLRQLGARLEAAHARQQAARAQRSDQAWLRLQGMRPQLRLHAGGQRLALLQGRLRMAIGARLSRDLHRLRDQAERLARQHPSQRLGAQRHRSELLAQRLNAAWGRRSERAAARLQQAGGLLHSFSPLATLGRGYAILRDGHGAILRQPSQVSVGDPVDAMLAEGRLRLRVDEAPDQA